jgi:hypothetical protein
MFDGVMADHLVSFACRAVVRQAPDEGGSSNPDFLIKHQASSIKHQASSIKHQASSI